MLQNKCTIILILFFCNVFFWKDTFSQKWGISSKIGSSGYNGDLSFTQIPRGKHIHGSFSLGGFMNISPVFRLKAMATFAKVSANDKSSSVFKRKRNLDFSSNIQELSLSWEYDYYNGGKQKGFVHYITGGIGLFHFNPKTIDRFGETVELQKIGTEGQYLPIGTPNRGRPYKLTQLNILFGMGVNYRFNEQWSVGFEVSGRLLFTDYLDDVSSSGYVNPSDFDEFGQFTAKLLSYRGDELNPPEPRIFRGVPSNNDSFGLMQLTCSYTIFPNRYKK
jgi:hypothetical protein